MTCCTHCLQLSVQEVIWVWVGLVLKKVTQIRSRKLFSLKHRKFLARQVPFGAKLASALLKDQWRMIK